MAKKGSRVMVGLLCSVCKNQNYVTVKNKVNTTSPIKLNKFCPKCLKHTEHKETKKLD